MSKMPTPPERKRCFPPVVDARTRLLVLGSLPGAKSLAAQQYYANPQNRFWRLMSAVLGTELVSLGYCARLDTLLSHGVGLWDVVAEAARAGSLDSQIREREDNDLLQLLRRYPGIRVLAFNGGTAARLGTRTLGADGAGYRIVQLPSSSPAHTMPYEEKLARWMVLQPLREAGSTRSNCA